MHWPPQSPDLNITDAVWDQMSTNSPSTSLENNSLSILKETDSSEFRLCWRVKVAIAKRWLSSSLEVHRLCFCLIHISMYACIRFNKFLWLFLFSLLNKKKYGVLQDCCTALIFQVLHIVNSSYRIRQKVHFEVCRLFTRGASAAQPNVAI